MKKYICALAAIALFTTFTACEKKETTVNNPPGETKTENNTTVVKEPSAPTKSETTINENTTVTSSPSP